ncbi:acylphosphatase [Thermophilibacter immobilis]|jgi:acylphosphatase|uniref:acylphosphatase n=1 Tax=Thermophilibacter immobilis TaxID=2779519 RepID=A0A7S7M967_9ACTN|nr:acylphosphatase [Thermophilibacter immobilis]QOY61019.1 acylphosphatase [Thermophilibacter immobilis]
MFIRRRRGRANNAPEVPSEDTRRLHLRFVGQVQGVGFRWTASAVARRLALTGWIRNEEDGSVTAEIQGSGEHVGAFFSQMVEEYRRYPISYAIDEREDRAPVASEREFEVRY